MAQNSSSRELQPHLLVEGLWGARKFGNSSVLLYDLGRISSTLQGGCWEDWL